MREERDLLRCLFKVDALMSAIQPRRRSLARHLEGFAWLIARNAVAIECQVVIGRKLRQALGAISIDSGRATLANLGRLLGRTRRAARRVLEAHGECDCLLCLEASQLAWLLGLARRTLARLTRKAVA
jgi:hypothetical protein